MNILLKPYSSFLYRKNAVFKIDNGDNILFGFKKKLSKLGIQVNTLDLGSKEKVDRYIFCDVPLPWELDYWIELLLHKNKAVLLCFESPLVNPFNHFRLLNKLFSSVYTWNDVLVSSKIKKMHLPSLNTNLNLREVAFNKKKLLCVINSNKSIPYPFLFLSPFKHDLYPERLKAINYFEKNLSNQFDLYGRGWNKPKKFSLKEKLFGYKRYLSYKGAVLRDSSSKVKILRRYKFNLCFENCIAPGYISEKIIDCFKAHTVPVYLGAPNVEKYIHKSCFIDFRDFKNYPDLLEYIKNMDEKTYNNYIANAKKLLSSKNFINTWFEDGFLKLFLKAISFER